MWWRISSAWYFCVAVRHASNVAKSDGWDALVEDPLLQSVPGGERLPVEVRPLLRVDEVGGVGHRLRAELRHEPHDPRHALRRAARRRGRRRGTSRSRSGCRCRRAAAGGGARRSSARTSRVGSAFSNERFTHRSSTVLFHDGQLMGGDVPQPGGCGVALDPDRHRRRVVVRVPLHDRRVVAELVDRRAGLVDRLAAHRPGVSPLEREVLEQEDAEFVGGVVDRSRRDVAVDAERVEAGLDRELDVASHLGRRRVGQPGAGRQQVGALQEQPFTVDRARPVVPGDDPQPGAADSGIADHTVDLDLDLDRGERLVAERPRPPQIRVRRCRCPS